MTKPFRLGNAAVAVLVVWFSLAAPALAPAAQPDLQLSLSASPAPVTLGELLTCQVTVTNASDQGATSVSLTSTFSSNASVFSVVVSQGSYSQAAGSVSCALGDLPPHAAATATLVLTPALVGTLTNSVVVTETETDANPADNTATATTLVVPVTFSAGPSMSTGRYCHSATLLPNGKVLIAGGQGPSGALSSAELYDPQLKAFVPTGSMPEPMYLHSATLLNDGTVLIAGGSADGVGAELYNPTNGTFTRLPNLVASHYCPTAALLPDGRVLITGGGGSEAAAELYDPLTRTFAATGSRVTGGSGVRSFLLANGTVAELGGTYWNSFPATNDLYVPASGTFVSLGLANFPQAYAGATPLADGTILMAGGYVNSSPSTVAELFNPASSNFTTVSAMNYPHGPATATRLSDGRVLIVGLDYNYSSSWSALHTPDLYDPVSRAFARTAPLASPRKNHTATLLPDGTVLIAGGLADYGTFLSSTEIYDPAHTKSPPAVTIADAAVTEGDSGTTNLLFPLTLSAPMGVPVSVSFGVILFPPGSASAGSDFIATNGTVVFPPGTTHLTIPVAVLGDHDFEPDETFQITLSNPVNAVLANDLATGTILNDDPRPTIAATPASVVEGNVGTNALTFTVYLSAASTETIAVSFFTSDGTALAGKDYYPTNGLLSFDPGVTNLTVTVGIRPNITIEADKVFYFNLVNPTNGVLGATQFPGTIVNDDGLPGMVEHFDLDPVASPQYVGLPFPVTVTARDVSGQTVTDFPTGVTLWATLTNVPYYRFDFEEGDLSQWTPLNLGGSPGPYQVVPFDVTGHGYPSMAFRLAADSTADGIARPVTLQGGVPYMLSVDLAAMNENPSYANLDASTAHLQVNGQEIGTSDLRVFGWIGALQTFRTNLVATYTPPSNGTYQVAILFSRGSLESEVWSYADNVRISAGPISPVWLAPFTSGVASGTLRANWPATSVSLLAEDPEGHLGAGSAFDVLPDADLGVRVSSNPTTGRVGTDLTLSFVLTNSGPSPASDVLLSNFISGDFVLRSLSSSQGVCSNVDNTLFCGAGTLTNRQSVTVTATLRPHLPGVLTSVPTVMSATYDPNLANNSVTTNLTINVPQVHIANVSVTEGDQGSTPASVAIWLDGPDGQTVAVNYATSAGTATDGLDYQGIVGTLTFPPDVVTQWLSVPILGDVIDEPNETFTVQLSNPLNCTLANNAATVTIVDNDPMPGLSISDFRLLEGKSGTTNAQFQVTLSGPSASYVYVYYRTLDGTAKAGTDYANTSGSLTFAPLTTSKIITVAVNGDTTPEPDETFSVQLYSPQNATLVRSTAVCTIVNDDPIPAPTLRFLSPLPGGANPVKLQLSGLAGFTYYVDTSSNLADWAPWTNFVFTGTTTNFQDAPVTGADRKFYRARIP